MRCPITPVNRKDVVSLALPFKSKFVYRSLIWLVRVLTETWIVLVRSGNN